jgi:4-amino-4-deoxy-L-arabinose transferase-like glycosyltransferase
MESSFLRVFVFLALLQCVGIVDHSLWTPDEPREAEIIREMSLKGEYLIPYLAGETFLEKPPLYYAVGIIFYNLLGSHFPEAGRLATLLFALGTLVVVYLTSRRIYSGEEAILAPLILATFPLFFLCSHKILVDMGLVFFITAGMCAFLVAFHEKSRAWYKVFWVSLACAFLCKGIIGLAIPGAGLLIFLLWQRDLSFVRQAWIIPGILLIVAVVAAWAGILYLKGGNGYLYTFFVYNQIGRFIPVGIIYEGGHARPFYYYLTDIPVQTMPFFLLFIPAAAVAKGLKSSERLLYSWILGGLLVLSISATKRPIYFLPMLPAMAMVIAQWMGRLNEQRGSVWEAYLLKAILLIILMVAVFLPVVYVKIGGSVAIAALVSAAFFGFFWILWSRCRKSLPLLAVLGWSLVFILWTPVAFAQIEKSKSYREIFVEMGRIVSHGQAVGYELTETVEALGPFYGHFPVKNIEDRALFMKALRNREAEYIIVLPGRVNQEMRNELSARASLVFQGGGEMRREMELWKMRLSP